MSIVFILYNMDTGWMYRTVNELSCVELYKSVCMHVLVGIVFDPCPSASDKNGLQGGEGVTYYENPTRMSYLCVLC